MFDLVDDLIFIDIKLSNTKLLPVPFWYVIVAGVFNGLKLLSGRSTSYLTWWWSQTFHIQLANFEPNAKTHTCVFLQFCNALN